MKVALGELFQETCAFSPLTTTEREFEVTPAADLASTYAGTESELGGGIDVLESNGAEIIGLSSARMVPGAGGPVEDTVFQTYAERIGTGLRETSPDAVLLVLHGSMMTTERDDPEGDLLSRVREIVGDVPVVVSLDHHAHLTERMVDAVNALVAYTTHPHTDVRETGEHAARLLLDTTRGETSPCVSMVKAPMTSATRTETDRQPMRGIFGLRRWFEAMHKDVLSVSFLPAHCWLDVPDLGFTAVAVTDDNPDLANQITRQLATYAWDRREAFKESFPSVTEAIDIAFRETGLVVISDRGDITLGGAPGDSPVILGELLSRTDTSDLAAAIPIVDREAVETLATRESERVTLPVGGKLTPEFEPITVEGTVESVHKGSLVQEGTYYAGTSFDAGTRVVFRIADRPIHLVLSSRPPLTTDPSFFSAHGISPTDKALLVVKSAGHFRPNFEPIAATILTVDTPGVCPVDLRKCPYEKARPLYPLDNIEFQPKPYLST